MSFQYENDISLILSKLENDFYLTKDQKEKLLIELSILLKKRDSYNAFIKTGS